MAGINSMTLSLLSGGRAGKLTAENMITLDTTSLLSGGSVGNAMSTYQLYQKNNAKLRENALKDPMVKSEVAYFKSLMNAGLKDTASLDKETAYFYEKMPGIKTVDQLFQDKRLTDYIAQAMGIGYMKDNVAALKQVLTTKPVIVGGNVSVAGPLSEIVNSAGGTTATVTKIVTGKVTNIVTDPVTGTMVGTIDDPLLGKITGTISGATTDPVTFVTTGSLTARINGTVTDKKETSPGVFTGTVTGTANGIITRVQTGPVYGGVTGKLTVNLSGPVTGVLTDVYTDPVTSVTTGKYTDPVTGLVVVGTVTGQSTNPITKKITGTITAATGTISNETINNLAGGAPLTGSVTKTLTGTLTGQTTDPITNITTATINDPVLGPITGVVTGANSILGVINGEVTGEVRGTTRTDFIGTISGTFTGEFFSSGVSSGTITDPTTGAAITGKLVNKRFDPLTGKMIADIVGTAMDPAKASVTGVLSGITVDPVTFAVTATSTSTEYRPANSSMVDDGSDPFAKEVARSLVLYEGLTVVQNSAQMAKFKTEYYQALATDTKVRDEVDYFERKILTLTSVDDLFKDQRMVDYLVGAYGLDAYKNNPQALKAALMTPPKSVNPDDPFNFAGIIVDPKLRKATEDLKLYTGTLGAIKTTTTIDKLENAYLAANDKSTIKKVDDIFNNRRLFNFVLTSLGLEDQQNSFALVKKALLSDPKDPTSLSAKLSDTRFKDAAGTIQLYSGVEVFKSPEMVAQLVAGYENVSYEGKIAQENEAVFYARYAEQRLGKITNVYELLSDKNLRTLVSGAFGIPTQIVNQGIETQAAYFTQRIKFDQLKDPNYVKKIISNYLTKSDLGQIV
ncbi:DUF1217 domain-containing protein [Lacibacterium aquatile]|uniref:DUF1217 domain-containing protein n=1 Tax=Lacibacterium aquatile TaxID=1168082 RepID=A0ABW5DQ90_9PROT